jgi:hypothetical protein
VIWESLFLLHRYHEGVSLLCENLMEEILRLCELGFCVGRL